MRCKSGWAGGRLTPCRAVPAVHAEEVVVSVDPNGSRVYEHVRRRVDTAHGQLVLALDHLRRHHTDPGRRDHGDGASTGLAVEDAIRRVAESLAELSGTLAAVTGEAAPGVETPDGR